MTPFNNATPFEPLPAVATGDSPSRLSQRRQLKDMQSMTSSLPSLPYRRSNTSTSSLHVSISTPPGSRSISPNGGWGPVKGHSSSVFTGTLGSDLRVNPINQNIEDPRHIIIQAYVPHIAVYTSADTDELVSEKGFHQGLWQLLRPFGEHIPGKVTIRDSNGASRVYDDFAVRFVQLGDGLEKQIRHTEAGRTVESLDADLNGASLPKVLHSPNASQRSRAGGDIEEIENVVERHLSYMEDFPEVAANDTQSSQQSNLSPFYTLYLRKLLSGLPLAPHETFSHPVACIIAISSRNLSPIEALRHLYDDSSRGSKRLPVWVNSEYLRYYILVHDEERDDISKSMSLFEQMKRHFGLHCHLLRLRSSQCVPTDDDSVKLPLSEWMSAGEELADIDANDIKDDVEDACPCIFESDVTAIKTFIREMVTQSVVPSMERCVSTWNDQVASRRRGISGRFINITKRWTGIGGTSRSSLAASNSGSATGANSNYDALQRFYKPDAPEAVMRKLADYAFMLRDWKLAHSVYDLVRADFSSDKAWEYHAAANEMTAISTLLLPQASKIRSETVDLTLETAAYSYITRCGALYGALRSLMLGMELLRLRGGPSTDDAARWGARMLESKVTGSVGDALVKERVAVCYATRKGAGSRGWGARTRKAALWNILAADDWLSLGKYTQAERRLADVKGLYDNLSNRESLSLFLAANNFLNGLEREVHIASLPSMVREGQELIEDEGTSSMDEESEALDMLTHRKSLIGTTAPPLSSLETAPLQALATSRDADFARDDDFE